MYASSCVCPRRGVATTWRYSLCQKQKQNLKVACCGATAEEEREEKAEIGGVDTPNKHEEEVEKGGVKNINNNKKKKTITNAPTVRETNEAKRPAVTRSPQSK
ncbi:unnamed protein product [Ceratitis capitata]|uniref:(Mediterranean fruit fly) hypothetical protein n=1 Tax=Ceratitis capitata TaxID=7213 RepID=A0A811UHK6_CERCA|nr:unnamed protein product [Ceratitis capitata]